MKTRKLFFMTVLAAGFFAASCTQGTKQDAKDSSSDNTKSVDISGVTIDASQSKVMWAGTMLGVYTHEGILELTTANLTVKDGKITGGKFVADMNSMVATDDNYNPEEGSTPEKLIGHLKSPDFFAVEEFPTATFQITASEGNTITGLLTIRGNTHEEKVENVQITKEGEQVKLTGDMTFDRKKYDVSWDSSIQDRVLSDDIELKIKLMGK